jgi:hypothetical protein
MPQSAQGLVMTQERILLDSGAERMILILSQEETLVQLEEAFGSLLELAILVIELQCRQCPR